MVPGQVVSDFLADQCKKSQHIWSIFPERWRLLLSSRVSRWTREDYHFTKKTEKYIALIPPWTKMFSDESWFSFRSSDSPFSHSGRIHLFFQTCSEITVSFSIIWYTVRRLLTRQRLTHFLKILEIFKIPNFFGELCQKYYKCQFFAPKNSEKCS